LALDAVIIGGGACGLMCAVQAGFLGKQTLVLEKNARPGAKILISGGGRCNFTNLYAGPANFQSENPDFMHSALAQWTVEDTVRFFGTYGIIGKEKTLGQLFPDSNKAADIVAVFTMLCSELGQEITCHAEALSVDKVDGLFIVNYRVGDKVRTVSAPKLVLAAGGLPVRKMGATDFGLRVAKQFGLRIVPPAPALVPLTVTGKDSEWYGMLSGNAFFCRVWNHRISFEENVLFTHWGLSGPAILQLSSYWRQGEAFYIDFLPGKDITAIIADHKKSAGRRQLSGLLGSLFSKKFAEALGSRAAVEKNLADLTSADLAGLHTLVHSFRVLAAGDKGYDKAEVMRGGVSTAELSSKTLEAKKVPGLYFGGECVDVTGWLGGYNFQWAWASGYVIACRL
jgi:predicted Rossmann fold flavoprotein